MSTDDSLPAEELSPVGRRRRVRTRSRWGLGLVAVAGVVVAALVWSWAGPSSVPVSASEMLRRAAEVSGTEPDAALEPGQYLRIETRSEGLNLWRADRATQEGMAGGWDVLQTAMCRSESTVPDLVPYPPEPEAALVHESSTVLYVPADRDDDWVFVHGDSEVVATYGPRRDEAIELWPEDDSHSYPCPGATTLEVDMARGYVVSIVHHDGWIMPDFVPDTPSRTTIDVSVVDSAP